MTNHEQLRQARPDIYALTLLRAKEKPDENLFKNDSYGFSWVLSPEGYDFWNDVWGKKDYTPFDDLYGANFSKKRPEGIEEFWPPKMTHKERLEVIEKYFTEMSDEEFEKVSERLFGNENPIKSDCTIITEELTIMEKWEKGWEIKRTNPHVYDASIIDVHQMKSGKIVIEFNNDCVVSYNIEGFNEKFTITPPCDCYAVNIEAQVIKPCNKVNLQNGYTCIPKNEIDQLIEKYKDK